MTKTLSIPTVSPDEAKELGEALLSELGYGGYSAERAKGFIMEGADANIVQEDTGMPVLVYAIALLKEEVVPTLIAAGANTEDTSWDHEGKTALGFALIKDLKDAANNLIDGGANIHHVDNKDRSVLHHAMHAFNTDAVKRLVDGGVVLTGATDTLKKLENRAEASEELTDKLKEMKEYLAGARKSRAEAEFDAEKKQLLHDRMIGSGMAAQKKIVLVPRLKLVRQST